MAFLPQGNPTKLRVGASGNLEGRDYQVLGRVVLSTADGYRWQEYRLRAATGEEVTLVYESGDWKYFRLFEPRQTMSAREAALVRVDDVVTVDGRTAAVTYVGHSRVVHVEGAAPPGSEFGNRSVYFNAEWSGGGLLVVSWTGGKIEFYQGRSLRPAVVARAFNLPFPSLWARAGGAVSSAIQRSPVGVTEVFFIGLFVLWLALRFGDSLGPREPVFNDPPSKLAAPAGRLPDHAVGRIGAHDYTVVGHAVLEIARPGRKFGRHEYRLTDEMGAPALLVQSPDGNPAEWQLLLPAAAAASFTPFEAAAIPAGRTKTADGKPAQVAVFMAKLEQSDGVRADWPATVQYGCVTQEPDRWVHARWTEQALQVYLGRRVPAADIAATFHSPGILSN